ncbi:MAG: O-antigen ligase family protein [Parcubacteria group bacterium]|nr:O-antigen ligase family protein [Parcubacteria group bacterium]
MMPILLFITAAFGLVTWMDPRKGLLLLVALLPSYLLRGELFGIPTTLLELMVIVFVIIWVIKRRPKLKALVPERAHLLPIALILMAATLSLFIAPDLSSAAGVWKAYFIEPILLFLIVRYELSRSSITADDLFKALGLTALVLSVVAIVQWITGAGIPIPWDIEKRVTSIFDYPNALGLFLGPVVIIAITQIRRPSSLSIRKLEKWFWLSVTLLSSIAILLAQSEAAIVAVLATVAVDGLLKRRTFYTTAVVISVAILFVLISPWRGLVMDKLTLQDYSGGVRLTGWSETIDLLQDKWLLGTGLSGYPAALAPYHQAKHLELFQYPHNIVLNFWTELGLLGLVAIMLLAWTVLSSFKHISFSLSNTRWVALLALMEILIHGLVDVPYFKNDLSILTWLLVAIALYAVHSTRSKKS